MGKGKVIYVGTMGDTALVQQVVDLALEWSQLEASETAPSGIEITRRVQHDAELLFILNHTPEMHQIQLNGSYQDIVTNTPKSGDVLLSAYDILILAEKGHDYVSSR